ncbi:MAG: HAMP domain-containing protein [Candidatus Eisenbacteria bacterium]|uniref:histidine kinase n=1 Tax=Eiseniibacteriota bacterium TaxID=2212470 RepID=A0A849SCW3_UNCEI|nr:HAMP domain-containing protein [Candidatus Eisenbacteria bacterium]
MIPHISLRWKILVLVLLTPAVLAAATLLTVNRNVSAHVDSSSIHESLEHAVSVFESVLQTRSRELAGGARVIARDPRFFSLLMLGPSQSDSRFVATMRGMAKDFNQIAQTDVFEVLDRRGRVLASVGAASSSRDARAGFVRAVLKGQPVEGILVERKLHFQVALTPVFADGRIVGALLMGREIGPALAHELRTMMKSEVTFVSGAEITGTTLEGPKERAALLAELARLSADPAVDPNLRPVERVKAGGQEFLTLVRRLPGSDPGAAQWYAMQRSFDPETEFAGRMRRHLLVLAAIALLAAGITGLLFSEQILRPIQSLVQGAREMEKGNYDYPLKVKNNDELGYLANRFADMRRQARAYFGGLEQAERLKSRFLAVASHELRTPISVLIGYHDVLANGELGAINPAQAGALQKMRSHLDRLTRLAEDSARFARVTGERLELDFQPQDVQSLVREAVNAGRAAGSGRSVRVEFVCEAGDLTIEADSQSLAHAIFQLVANGIRFTPDGGRVDVRVTRHGERLHVEVRDSGIGIDVEGIGSALANGFSAADSLTYHSARGLEFNARGLGLGLPIASAIVQAHGGTIRAQKGAEGGSLFVIDVPLKRPVEMSEAA